MKDITELIKARRSVRTFDGQIPDDSTKAALLSCLQAVKNPFDIPVTFQFLDAKEYGLICPVVTGTELYVGGKIEAVPNACVAFGYSFEAFVLYAQSLGLGTVWLGGTMNRSAFEKAMALREGEAMPCASALGYPAGRMSTREAVMRKAIKADARLPFEELFSDGHPGVPLTKEKAGKLALPLEMVRLAPSAVNRQPWRVIAEGDAAHFYLKRSKGIGVGSMLDMQMIDMGIALCHFALTAEAQGLQPDFFREQPAHIHGEGLQYIASYRIR